MITVDTDLYTYVQNNIPVTLPDMSTVTKNVYANSQEVWVYEYSKNSNIFMRAVYYSGGVICIILCDNNDNIPTRIYVPNGNCLASIKYTPDEVSNQLYNIKTIVNSVYDDETNNKTMRLTSVNYNTYDSKYQYIIEYGCWKDSCRALGIHVVNGYRVIYNLYLDPINCFCLKHISTGVPTFIGGFGMPGYSL
jgi:hypothetical protein